MSQFPNSKPTSEINRDRRRAKQVPPDVPKPPREVSQPQSVQPDVPKPPREVSQPQSVQPDVPKPPREVSQPEVSFDAVSREAARRRQDFTRVSSKTQYELYRLANGNVQTIDRLLIHARSRHPDRPEQWIWEKVIYDLERDRH